MTDPDLYDDLYDVLRGDRRALDRFVLEIPHLLVWHAQKYPGARKLEEMGRKVAGAGFQPDASVEFVQDVMKWGAGHRQMSRVRDKDTPDEVAAALRDGAMLAQSGDVAEGVERICRLRNLGHAFASKQLRFLEPARAVIIDSWIHDGLGYALNTAGYRVFLKDCLRTLAHISLDNLRVCDIECAIYAKLKRKQ
jgi:hypothetical protein